MSVMDEQLETLDDSRRFFPRPISLESVKRYCRRGYRGHRLESVIVANRRHTSRQAVERFVEAISQPPAKTEVTQ